MALATLEPLKGNFSDLVMARFIPLMFVVAGFGSNLLDSHPLRQIVGVEANWGTRTLLIMCFMIAWCIVGLYLWPSKQTLSVSEMKSQPTKASTLP